MLMLLPNLLVAMRSCQYRTNDLSPTKQIIQRNWNIKVLVANLAQPGESWADVLHQCGLAHSSQGIKVAMEGLSGTAAPDDLVIYTGSGEWSALYRNGKLERVGDHYWVEERAFFLAGVPVIQSDDFLMGGDGRDDVAQTVDDLRRYTVKRVHNEERAIEPESPGTKVA